MGWDGKILPVPEIPYSANLYNDTEDAIVTLLDADAYTQSSLGAGAGTSGDGGIVKIEARPITDTTLEAIVNEAHEGIVPAIYVDAQDKDEEIDEHFGTWGIPINVVIAVVQGGAVLDTLDNNTKRRLCEIERVLRQRAGANADPGFWNNTHTWIRESHILIGTGNTVAYFGVGLLRVTVISEVENRQEAL